MPRRGCILGNAARRQDRPAKRMGEGCPVKPWWRTAPASRRRPELNDRRLPTQSSVVCLKRSREASSFTAVYTGLNIFEILSQSWRAVYWKGVRFRCSTQVWPLGQSASGMLLSGRRRPPFIQRRCRDSCQGFPACSGKKLPLLTALPNTTGKSFSCNLPSQPLSQYGLALNSHEYGVCDKFGDRRS